MLDEYERLRLIEEYRPVSPAWRHLGMSAFWVVTTAAILSVTLFYSFSSRVEDLLLVAAGSVGALSLVSLVTATTVAVRHRRQMEGPYQVPPEDPDGPSTQMGTSRPAKAM